MRFICKIYLVQWGKLYAMLWGKGINWPPASGPWWSPLHTCSRAPCCWTQPHNSPSGCKQVPHNRHRPLGESPLPQKFPWCCLRYCAVKFWSKKTMVWYLLRFWHSHYTWPHLFHVSNTKFYWTPAFKKKPDCLTSEVPNNCSRIALGTLMPPSHWLVSCRSVKFLRSLCDRIDSPGTTNSFSGSAGGKLAAGRAWRNHKGEEQNLGFQLIISLLL